MGRHGRCARSPLSACVLVDAAKGGLSTCSGAREAAATAVAAEKKVAVRPAMEEGKEVRAEPWSPRQWPAKAAGVAGAAPAGSSVSGRGGMFSDSLLRRVAGRGGGRRERNGAVGRAGVASSRPTRGRGRWFFCSKSELAWMMFEVVTAFPVPVTLAGLSLVVFRPLVPVGLLVDSGVEVGARRNPGFCRRRRRLWAL
jgi:hypothetical protein